MEKSVYGFRCLWKKVFMDKSVYGFRCLWKKVFAVKSAKCHVFTVKVFTVKVLQSQRKHINVNMSMSNHTSLH
jgi:hypothetical protein